MIYEQTNTWEGGLNKDHNKLTQPSNTYIDANNIRITTYEGSSNLSISNSRGNTFVLSIPNTSNVWKITQAQLGTGISPYTISINGVTKTGTVDKTIDNFVSIINSHPAYANFHAYSSPDSTYLLLNSPSGSAVNATPFITVNTGQQNFTLEVPAQINLFPIGCTTIREETILITTNEINKPPLPINGGVTQIWRLTYDRAILTANLSLLYNNHLNCTQYHSIAPSAIIGRRENDDIKRIYWTDNFNQFRAFNTANVNGFAIPPSLINAQQPIDITIPTLKSIGSGSLLAGMYQSCYRLKNKNAVTFWSELSNLTQICAHSVAEAVATGGTHSELYIGEPIGTNCNKSITWQIKDLDNNYERIEIAILFFDTVNGSPDIRITHDEPLPTNGQFQFTYTGVELIQKLTSLEFLNQTFAFTHCKTLTTKGNELIVGNVRSDKVDFIYDARAYRFGVNQSILYVIDGNGNPLTIGNPVTSSPPWNVPETHDTINANQDSYKYQIGSNKLGGTGPNISYEFGTYSVKIDDSIDLASTGVSSYAHTNPSYTTGIWNSGGIHFGPLNQEYPQNNINDGIKYAYLSDLLRTYQHTEIYRFAILFYDKLGRPLFARWIGDIKMPEYVDKNSNPDQIAKNYFNSPGNEDFRTSFIYNNSTYTQMLYVKFNVNIPSTIRPLVSGYRIVRCERKQSDKSILAAGLLTQCISNGGGLSNGCNLFAPGQAGSLSGLADLNNANEGSASGDAFTTAYTFDSPDFLIGSYPGYASGDKIMVAEVLQKDTIQVTTDVTPPNETQPYRIVKYYDAGNQYLTQSGTTNSYTIEEAGMLGYGAFSSYVFSGTNNLEVYGNYNETTTNTSRGVGNKTLVLGLSQALSSVNTYNVKTNGGYKRIYALYYRPNPNQYGGKTYSARSRNEYIPCGSLQPINDSNVSQTSFTTQVLGGDIFKDVYDHQKILKNVNQTTSGRGTASPKESFSYFWACESAFNMNLRYGTHINKDLGINGGASGFGSGASYTESWDFNSVYDQQNNFITYIPKPLNFHSTEEFDTRIWVSEQKEDGEDSDSWIQFLPARYYDAEGAYGPINSLITWKDRVYFFQNDGYGIVPIGERAVIAANVVNTTELQLGKTDGIIQRPEYLSKIIGSKHQWSVTSSADAIYFFDANSKQLYATNEQGLRELPGLSGYFKSQLLGNILTIDKPLYNDPILLRSGISCVANYVTNDIYYTFFDSHYDDNANLIQFSKTVCYNEKLKVFTSFMSFIPYFYINTHDDIWTVPLTSKKDLYIHDKDELLNTFYSNYYNTTYPSSVSFIANKPLKHTKLFNNLEWESETLIPSRTDQPNINTQNNTIGDTWTRVRVYNDYQNTDWVTLNPANKLSVRRKERKWRHSINRNAISPTKGQPIDIFDSANFNKTRLHKEHIRDQYAVIELEYDNTTGYRFICPYVHSKYLISAS